MVGSHPSSAAKGDAENIAGRARVSIGKFQEAYHPHQNPQEKIFYQSQNKSLTGRGSSRSPSVSPDLRRTTMNLTNSDLLRILWLLPFSEENEPHKFYMALGLQKMLERMLPDSICLAHHFAEVSELLRALNPNAKVEARQQ